MTKAAYRHSDEISGCIRAATLVVPEILAVTGPIRSVVDVGGGSGAWLEAFRNRGVEKLRLIDVPQARALLRIEEEFFEPADLNAGLPEVRPFDLAVCLECVEHLREGSAIPIVNWLTSSADRVVFSAAIPGQGGIGHINLKNADYWTELFVRRGFVRRDVLRPRIIHNSSVPYWYRQNMFLFVKPGVRLNAEEGDFLPPDFQLVYKTIFDRFESPNVRELLRQLRKAVMTSFRRKATKSSSVANRHP